MKVLVVDDNRDILQAIEMIMEAEGHQTKCISKGEEVIEQVSSFHPDIIILDYLLSGNDGRVICKKLKTSTEYSDIPVIMISAHPKIKDTVMEYGADSFLAKPFSVGSLLDEIGQFN